MAVNKGNLFDSQLLILFFLLQTIKKKQLKKALKVNLNLFIISSNILFNQLKANFFLNNQISTQIQNLTKIFE